MSRAVAVVSLVLVQVSSLLASSGVPRTHTSAQPPVSAASQSIALDPLVHPRPIAAQVVDVRPARAARHVAVRRTGLVVRAGRHRETGWERLMSAVSRIPGYRAGEAVWALTPRTGHWGVADWYSGVVYVSPAVPVGFLYSVVVHEWSHLLSVRVYGGDVPRAVAAMNRYFGGGGLVGAERAADCMARLLGATWTHYTRCADPRWRAGARRLVSLRPL